MAGPGKTSKAPRKRPKSDADAAPGAGVSAEALLGRLDEVVRELETGELPLEQALARFEEGVRLVRDGEQLLASVEQRIEILLADDRVAPFANEQDYADHDHDHDDDQQPE
ncbi:exodeoxyribonuclease VII small subunit [Enhygromyxa salina]|uniref:Exodeoxyribonuclease 7 small subunit n=1 Tax=Enhygromyxa salina TaxID=215803 RepID=A0A2S9YTV7_9BACT|nr:exodeoxyribonuclease VII small subunit [Enhygromyxa salina]PRQ08547.1 Exodeoxyribonuclease 7 small subunit [Enhygromyxa salina]